MADIDPEAELLKMLADDELPKHLRLGAINKLIELRDGIPAPVNGHASGQVVMPDREDGLPPDPLLEDFPPPLGEHGRMPHADCMSDLDWCQVVGRMPHALYAKVLWVVPASADKRTLVDAEARFLREARNRGFDTEADEVAEVRRRRRRERNRRER